MGNPYDLPVPHRNTQQHPDVYELNDMVGVMAFQDDALAEQMLPTPPGKGRKEIIGESLTRAVISMYQAGNGQ